MALTQLQKLELNKRVDKILHAPSNAPISGQQLEIAFVVDMESGTDNIYSSVQDAVAALKSHDKIFQNVRSNMVYWKKYQTLSKVIPMSFIQMGKAFEDNHVDNYVDNVDNLQNFETLCEYLKLYHARCRCILLFLSCTYAEFENTNFRTTDIKKAVENLNPFLKNRLLAITTDKMMAGSELMIKLLQK